MTTGSQPPQPKKDDPDRDVRIGMRLMAVVGVVIVLGVIGLRAVQGLSEFQQMMVGWCEWSGPGRPGLPGSGSDCATWASQLMLAHPQIVLDCTTSLVSMQTFYQCMDQNAGPFR